MSFFMAMHPFCEMETTEDPTPQRRGDGRSKQANLVALIAQCGQMGKLRRNGARAPQARNRENGRP
jgi:hypothetical protein